MFSLRQQHRGLVGRKPVLPGARAQAVCVPSRPREARALRRQRRAASLPVVRPRVHGRLQRTAIELPGVCGARHQLDVGAGRSSMPAVQERSVSRGSRDSHDLLTACPRAERRGHELAAAQRCAATSGVRLDARRSRVWTRRSGNSIFRSDAPRPQLRSSVRRTRRCMAEEERCHAHVARGSRPSAARCPSLVSSRSPRAARTARRRRIAVPPRDQPRQPCSPTRRCTVRSARRRTADWVRRRAAARRAIRASDRSGRRHRALRNAADHASVANTGGRRAPLRDLVLMACRRRRRGMGPVHLRRRRSACLLSSPGVPA